MTRYYSNQAVNTTIMSAQFNSSATSLIVASNSGYPQSYPFTLRINPGAVDEEIVDVVGGMGVQGNAWIVSRGQDGTTPRTWQQGTPVAHGFSARDFAELQSGGSSGGGGGSGGTVGGGLPIGGIFLWYGAVNSIPVKFALCDGKSYDKDTGAWVTENTPNSIKTPDLRDRFVYGAGNSKSPGATGGSNQMTAASMPAHTHTSSSEAHNHVVSGGAHDHNIKWRAMPTSYTSTGNAVPTTSSPAAGTSDAFTYEGSGSSHSHTVSSSSHSHTIGSTGSGDGENNMPSWMALCYVMRVA